MRDNVQENTSLVSTQWNRGICPKLLRTAAQASNCKEACIFMEKAIEELSKQIDDICKKKFRIRKQ